MARTIRLALVMGSTRGGRLCDAVARWAACEAEKDGRFLIDMVDPAAIDLDDARAARDLRMRLGEAEAFLIVTPEYNRSFPAPLKALIDSVSAEWGAKPVAFVSYGGISGGLRAVEQLRLVFAELHAVGLRDGVAFPNAWQRFEADGTLADPERSTAAMRTTLARLVWWAEALSTARAQTAYGEAA